MATITALSTGLQTITATGVVTPTAGVDVSAMTDATICVEVVSLTASKTARVQLEDTANGWTASAALAVFDFIGQMGQGGTSYSAGSYNPTTDKRSIRKYQLPNSNIDVASGKVRLNVTAIDSGSELLLNAWIES